MKTRRFCPHCGRPLLKSQIKGYSFQCLACGEDFYKIEVLRKKDLRKVKALRRNNAVPIADNWWYGTEFILMERITGYRQYNFDHEEGYQAFVDACDKYWESLSKSDKIDIWEEYKV
jgi:uncharacterized Zn finger protein (UPF0148 family)